MSYEECEKVDEVVEDNATYEELMKQEKLMRQEELKETHKNICKLLTKEMHAPMVFKEDDDLDEKNKEIEVLIHNLRGFVTVLQDARTPHQARPPRQK